MANCEKTKLAVEVRGESSVHFDDMTWPAGGKPLDDLEWALRYGDAPMEMRLRAASVCAAYRELLLCTDVKRKRVARTLRRHWL